MDYQSFSPECLDTNEESHTQSLSPFGSFGKDDLLLLGLILLFLTDECEDKSILLILAFLFFSGLSS